MDDRCGAISDRVIDAMWYYSSAGPALGLLMFAAVRTPIGILEAPKDAVPVGTAICVGSDAAGMAVWHLTIRGAELPGRWIVVDREFRPVR
jgi:hypothetical protein